MREGKYGLLVALAMLGSLGCKTANHNSAKGMSPMRSLGGSGVAADSMPPMIPELITVYIDGAEPKGVVVVDGLNWARAPIFFDGKFITLKTTGKQSFSELGLSVKATRVNPFTLEKTPVDLGDISQSDHWSGDSVSINSGLKNGKHPLAHGDIFQLEVLDPKFSKSRAATYFVKYGKPQEMEWARFPIFYRVSGDDSKSFQKFSPSWAPQYRFNFAGANFQYFGMGIAAAPIAVQDPGTLQVSNRFSGGPMVDLAGWINGGILWDTHGAPYFAIGFNSQIGKHIFQQGEK